MSYMATNLHSSHAWQSFTEDDNALKVSRLGFWNGSNFWSLAELDFYWKVKLAKAPAQNLLQDKAVGITLIYSRCPCTLRTANNKLLGKYEKDFGRLSKFNKINFIHIWNDYSQNGLAEFRSIISSGLLTLELWETFCISIRMGTISIVSHIQWVSIHWFILHQKFRAASSQAKDHPRVETKRVCRRNCGKIWPWSWKSPFL